MPTTKKYNLVAEGAHSTVVAEYTPEGKRASSYQSEADLERAFVAQLEAQAYERLTLHSEEDLVVNLRKQLELLNDYSFTDKEW